MRHSGGNYLITAEFLKNSFEFLHHKGKLFVRLINYLLLWKEMWINEVSRNDGRVLWYLSQFGK